VPGIRGIDDHHEFVHRIRDGRCFRSFDHRSKGALVPSRLAHTDRSSTLERQLLPCQEPTRRGRGELGSVRPSTEIGVPYVCGGNSLRCVQHLPTSRRQISHFRARPRWCRIG
jgi:hypothetical protein